MKASLVSVLAVIAFLGCDTSRTLPRLDGITRVEVRTNLDSLGTIDDSQRITAIVGFANARRDKWKKPWAGVPVGTLGVTFYAGRTVQGSFTAGLDFFESQQEGDWFSRDATATEVAEWRALLAPYRAVTSR